MARGTRDKKCSIFDYCFAWRFTERRGTRDGEERKQRDGEREEPRGEQSVGVRGIVLFKRNRTPPRRSPGFIGN